LIVVVLVTSHCPADHAVARDKNYRWQGHDWVFVFSSDDGLMHNVGWDAVADSLDFNFTIFINQYRTANPGNNACYKAPFSALQLLAARGNEIGQHGYDHGHWGLDTGGDCSGPWGGFTNYWDTECYPDGTTYADAMENFNVEVCRDSMCNWLGVDPVTVAFPAHLHSDSVMYYLEELGYIGARDGCGWWQSTNFTVHPLNSWDGGMSLYRMSTLTVTAILWGDHWDQDGHVPQHFSVETFRAKFDSVLAANDIIEDGKMFCLYTHDFGADDDRYCDRNYHRGGLTPEELAETVTYARERGAIVMTFGEACAWYRDHAVLVVDPVAEYGPDYAGDIIWRPDTPAPSEPARVAPDLEQNHPNPFNPDTEIGFVLVTGGPTSLSVFDLAGRQIRVLVDDLLPAGRHVARWDGRDADGNGVASGTYYYRLETDARRETRKMTLVR